jgi:ABC-2 type transport system permease protein
MIALKNSLAVFLQFMRRDLFTCRKHFIDNLVNYAVIYPIVFALQSGYFQANANFVSPNPMLNTVLFAGNILLVLLLFTYKQNIELLFDLEGKRYIDYQITVLNPFLVLVQKILFTGLYAFIVSLPYYPMGALILQKYINVSNAHWLQLILVLFAGSLCMSAWHLLAAVVLKRSTDIGTLWSRANGMLMAFGGFWVPLWAMKKYSPFLGKLVYLNPCLYLTEGVKHAITGSSEYLPISVCVSMLLLFTCIITGAAWFRFKQRTDCL